MVAARRQSVYMLEFAGLLTGLPLMPAEGVLRAHAYAFDSMFTRGLANGLCFGEECRGAVPRPERNQIERLERELAALSGPQHRTTASLAISTDICRDETGGRCS